jgi:hypothetical protein
MPAIIDSSPDCVTNVEGMKPADDVADFILQANYEDCAGFMTFGPGSTYGEEGTGAAGAYMVLTWLGIVVMVLVFVAWIVYENRRLLEYTVTHAFDRRATDEPPPQPGTMA